LGFSLSLFRSPCLSLFRSPCLSLSLARALSLSLSLSLSLALALALRKHAYKNTKHKHKHKVIEEEEEGREQMRLAVDGCLAVALLAARTSLPPSLPPLSVVCCGVRCERVGCLCVCVGCVCACACACVRACVNRGEHGRGDRAHHFAHDAHSSTALNGLEFGRGRFFAGAQAPHARCIVCEYVCIFVCMCMRVAVTLYTHIHLRITYGPNHHTRQDRVSVSILYTRVRVWFSLCVCVCVVCACGRAIIGFACAGFSFSSRTSELGMRRSS